MAFASSRVGAQEAIIKPCDLCEDNENVNWFCKDCSKNLCQRCTKGHLKIDICKNHNVVSILEGAAITKENIQVLCEDHNSPFSFFCRSCDTLVCTKCLSKIHSTHDFVDIHEFQTELQNELESVIEEKKKERRNISKSIDEFEKYTNTYGKALTQNYVDIDQRVESIKKAVHKEGKKLKTTLKAKTKERLKEANESKQKLLAKKNDYDTELQAVTRKLRLQTASTLKQFVEDSTSTLQTLRPLSLPIPKYFTFIDSRIEQDHIRNIIGSCKDRVTLDADCKKIEIVRIYELRLIEKDCFSICTGPDCSIWLGSKGNVFKMKSDLSAILRQIPSRKPSWSCDFIACLQSDDAIVSYGKTNCVDRFSSEGKVEEFGYKSIRFTYNIAVSKEDEVAIAVSNILSKSILLFTKDGKQQKEINVARNMESFCFDRTDNIITSNRESYRLSTIDRRGTVLENMQISKPSLRRMRSDEYGNILGICGNGKEVCLISPDGDVLPPLTIDCDDCINDICIDKENRLLILVDHKKVIVAKYL